MSLSEPVLDTARLACLRRSLRLTEKCEGSVRAQLTFNKDRFKFAKHLFEPVSVSYSIGKDETEEYFVALTPTTRVSPPFLPRLACLALLGPCIYDPA